MINEISIEDFSAINDSIQELQALEKFHDQWQSNDKVVSIWEAFRLLPMQSGYLIASHFYNRELGWGWFFHTKWDLYTKFDHLVKNEGVTYKISAAIHSALQTQKKIVTLEKAFHSFGRNEPALELKNHIFTKIKEENLELYHEITHNIWIARGKPEQVDMETIETTELLSKAVIEKMLYYYKEGYPTLSDHLFEELTTTTDSSEVLLV
jgi:hypothetical protein